MACAVPCPICQGMGLQPSDVSAAMAQADYERNKSQMTLVLHNGAKPLMHVWNHTSTTGVVLAKYGEEWVVWTMERNPLDGSIHCEHGHYFRPSDTVDSAVIAFTNQVARFFNLQLERGAV